MPAAFPSTLKIKTSFRNGRWTLHLRGPRMKEDMVIETAIREEGLADLRLEFRHTMQSIFDDQEAELLEEKDAIKQQCQPDWRNESERIIMLEGRFQRLRQEQCQKALGAMIKAGTDLRKRLLGKHIYVIRGLLQAGCPSWMEVWHSRPSYDAERHWKLMPEVEAERPLPALVLLSDGPSFFPLEMLPLLGARKTLSDNVESRAMCLPAACMPVTRLFRGRVLQNAALENSRRLTVHAFAHLGDDLLATEREVGFLAQMEAFRGPRRVQPSSGQTRSSVVRSLTNALTSNKTHVVHLCCHAQTVENEPSLWLRSQDGQDELEISLADLEDALLKKKPHGKETVRPLVFFNACGSMFQPANADSFAKMFWDNGNVGFVGADTDVRDSSSADMGKSFYHYLHAGYAAPRALQLARLQLLRERHALAGFVYSYYGHPELKVTAPTQWYYPPIH